MRLYREGPPDTLSDAADEPAPAAENTARKGDAGGGACSAPASPLASPYGSQSKGRSGSARGRGRGGHAAQLPGSVVRLQAGILASNP